MAGTLFIVATPIGNLEDITYRAVRVLKEAEAIYAEQPNVTKRLLQHYNISTRPVKLNQHADGRAMGRVIAALKQGKNIAYVSSAGTPGISDPGEKLVGSVRDALADTVTITPIPGPSAVIALAQVAGVPVDRFYFAGFPPHKKGRQKFFNDFAQRNEPIIFYESPHRIKKSLHALLEILGEERRVLIGREITKKFEEFFSGTLREAELWVADSGARGEYVILIERER